MTAIYKTYTASLFIKNNALVVYLYVYFFNTSWE